MNYNRMIKTDEDMEAAFAGMKATVKYKRKEFQSLSASEISYEYGAHS